MQHTTLTYALGLLLLFTQQVLWSQCNISASSSGANSSYTQEYVLVDATTQNIIAVNSSGSFDGVTPGVYQIHALNYNPANAPLPLPAGLIGQQVSQVGSTDAGCFNADFTSDYVTRVCASCQQSSTVCETDPVNVSSSGGNSSYTQLYVMVDAASDTIISTSSTGNFTGTVAAGNSYRIHALNYNPADPPSPLPVAGHLVTALGQTSRGCYNSDYLSDYICYNVTACGTSCFNNTSVCNGDNIVASTSGQNEAYTQVFVLTDSAGNFVDQNSVGTFPTTGLTTGATYQVHALNYNPSDPPSPLPSGLAFGDNISTISGGCFNLDFATDYRCFTIDCTILSTAVRHFYGDKEVRVNQLYWSLEQEENLMSMHLERSVDGIQNFVKLANIPANGNPQYKYADELPLAKSYYRLKFLHQDGTHSYSSLVYLQRDQLQAGNVQVFPNPTKSSVQISWFSPASGQLELEVYNVLGQQLAAQQLSLQVGNNQWQLELANYADGVYLLTLRHKNLQINRRIEKVSR